jgi:4-hydroxybenzoate polyprenyltransferase
MTEVRQEEMPLVLEGNVHVPLCVELDRTLIRSDTLAEGIARYLKQHVWGIFPILFWLVLGRTKLRAEIAKRTDLEYTSVRVNETFLEWLQEQRRLGRHLILCTAAHEKIAKRLGYHYDLFDEIIASSDTVSLVGRKKADHLVSRFGAQRFDYAGSDPVELCVWEAARQAVVVEPGWGMRRRLRQLPRVERVFSSHGNSIRAWIRALRLHQWSKNVLIFLPAAAAHRLFQRDAAFASIAAFVTFGLCASGTYLINDLMDLDADRHHPVKRDRPFAAGSLSLGLGFLMALALIIVGLVAAGLLVGRLFLATLATYLIATVWYSRSLKRVPMVDVLALAGLYAIRVIAGAAATAIILSFWLLAFTMFLFLSLAMAKRYSELKLMMAAGRTRASGRGYTIEDAPLLQACGVAAGYNSVLVMALYVNSGIAIGSTYTRPVFLWLLCPLLLYWITRVWIKTSRGQMDNDPVVFTLQDLPSLGAACAGLLLIWMAT